MDSPPVPGRQEQTGSEAARTPRLIVGISRSPASWRALDWAIGEAGRRGALLVLVHVFRPPLVEPAPDREPGYPGRTGNTYQDRVSRGNALVWTAIGHAVGRMPPDVRWEEAVIPGGTARALAAVAREGDLLVLGSRRRGLVRRLQPGSVARRCARRARCPVMIVPERSHRALPTSLTASHGPAPGHR